jgi:hypothetical protein
MGKMLAYLVVEQDRRDLYLAEDLSEKEKQRAEGVARTMEETGLIFE